MSAYVCHRTNPTLRSIVALSGDGASITTRYAASAAAGPVAGVSAVASAASTLAAKSGAAVRISARRQRSELRNGVAVNGTASIIVDHDIALCEVVVRCCIGNVVDGCAKGARRVAKLARPTRRKLAWPHRWKLGNLLPRPVEIPVHAWRIAETPEPNADARHAGAVVANRAAGKGDDARGSEQRR